MAVCYLLGGRPYRSAAQQTTFAQDGYLMGVVRAHGLDAVIQRDGDLLAAIFTTGCASALLAGLLVEDGKPWSREDATANAARFDRLTAQEEKDQLLAALEGLLAGFFPIGARSSTASPTSSAGKGTRRSRRATARETAAASGSSSSPPSPSTPASA